MRVHHGGFDPARFLPPGDNPEGGYAWFLSTQLGEPDVLILVAARGDDVIGYMYAAIEPMSWRELRDRAGFVHDLAVREDRQGAGLEARLLDEALAWMRVRGLPRALLWAAESNEVAQRLFARADFRRTMVEMTREL
jgi:ribosomal protein S18 acetylase RimI-like enzyme